MTFITWLKAGIAIALLAGSFGLGDYWRGTSDTAASTHGLRVELAAKNKEIEQDKHDADAQAAKAASLAEQLIKTNAERTAHELQIAEWQRNETSSIADLKKGSDNANATLNSICWPSDTERKLRQDAITAFLRDTTRATRADSNGNSISKVSTANRTN